MDPFRIKTSKAAEKLREILKRLLRKREKKKKIKEGFIRCSICGKVVKKEKAILSLPEEIWICDDCFFGKAKGVEEEE